MTHYAPDPLLILRLRGTQAQMGAQMGRLIREAGGHENNMDFYSRMASAMLSLSIPRRARPAARRALQLALNVGADRLHRARARHFPDYLARTQALFEAAGLDASLERSLAVMDVLQNTVGTVGRMGLLEPTGLQVAAIPACTSLAVWGESSDDGTLRHARNFDFPGAGVWDRTPSLAFCDPEGDGLRYGFVATRGADVPGITAFNEAGLSVTAHTRFHRDVNFNGVSAVDFGHEIVRRCRTLDDVRHHVGGLRTASTWGFLVSSAEEQDAMVVETTAKALSFVESRPGASHMAQANRYLDPELAKGEVTSSVSFAVDSDARHARANSAVERCEGGRLSRDDLERLLGDTGDPWSPDPDAKDRLGGNCIVSAMTVTSVIFEPEKSRLRLSVGAAPTSLGPWVDVPYEWDGPVESRELQSRPRSTANPAPTRLYVAATRAHLGADSPREVRAKFEAAVDAAPTEPNYRFMAAIFAVMAGDFPIATAHLECALERERGSYRRALLLLWHARSLCASRRRDQAQSVWRDLSECENGPGVAALRAAGAKESRRPLGRLRLRAVVPDVFLIDAAVPGVSLDQ